MTKKIRYCRQCGATDKPLSVKGLCPACGEANLRANIEGLKAKKGENYERWKRGFVRMLEREERERNEKE